MVKIIKNKRAWLRIVEATISVLLILGAVLIFYQVQQVKIKNFSTEDAKTILTEISKNDSLRKSIISDTTSSAETKLKQEFLSKRIIRRDLNYTIKVCQVSEPCLFNEIPANLDGDITSSEIIISTSLENDFNAQTTPRKVKLYLWQIK